MGTRLNKLLNKHLPWRLDAGRAIQAGLNHSINTDYYRNMWLTDWLLRKLLIEPLTEQMNRENALLRHLHNK